MAPEPAGPHFTLLSELITDITSARTERDVYATVARGLPELVAADRVTVAIPTADRAHLEVFNLHSQQGALPAGVTLPVDGSTVGIAFRTNQAWIRLIDPDSAMADDIALSRHGIREYINAPLSSRDSVLGTLNVGSTRPGSYNGLDLGTVHHVARLVATTLDRLRLHEQARQTSELATIRATRLEILNEIGEELSACLNDDEAHQALLTGVRRLAPDALRGSVVRFDDALTRFQVVTFSGVDAVPADWQPIRGASFEHLLATRRPLAWVDLEATRYRDHLQLSRAGLKHTLSIPMTAGNRVVGAVNLGLDRLPVDEVEILGALRTLGRLGGATLDRLAAQTQAAAVLDALIDGSPVLLVALDGDGTIRRISQLGAAALGYGGVRLVGEAFSTLHPAGDDGAARASRWARMPGDEVDIQEVQMCTRDGRLIWARQSARVVHSGGDGPLVLVVCEDITAIRELTSTLLHQAQHDPLTGLPNRRSFERALLDAIDGGTRPGSGFALLFIDLDRFKAVNDGYGHGVGDALLRGVADRILSELKGKDMASRIGGDEFQVLLRDIEDVGDAVAMANGLRECLLSGFELEGRLIDIGCSIGISRFPADGGEAEELIRRADTALRLAKRLGRNNVQVYRAEIDNSAAVAD